MLLADTDLSSLNADFIKSALIFLTWLVTTGAAIYGGRTWGKKGNKENPVNIAQPLDVRKHDDAAKKSELVKVEAALTKVEQALTSQAEQITAQFNEVKRAGESRAAAITQSIDEEITSLSMKIGSLADALHEKINHALIECAQHGVGIDTLKAGEFRHNGEITRIQEHISSLLARPICSHSPNRKS